MTIANHITVWECEHGFAEIVETDDRQIFVREHCGDQFIDHHEPDSIWIFCRYPKGIYNAVRGWARHEADEDGYRLARRFFAKNPAVQQLPVDPADQVEDTGD